MYTQSSTGAAASGGVLLQYSKLDKPHLAAIGGIFSREFSHHGA
jgi:hypothetical protein